MTELERLIEFIKENVTNGFGAIYNNSKTK